MKDLMADVLWITKIQIVKNQISNSCKNPIMKIVNDLIQTVFFIPVLIHPYEYSDPVIDTLCPILMKTNDWNTVRKKNQSPILFHRNHRLWTTTYSSDEAMSVASLKAGYRLR